MKKKPPIYDDGRTIVNMNVDGMPWYNPSRGKNIDKKDKPTRKEKNAMILGAFRASFPFFISTIAMFTLVMLLIYLWVA